MRLTRIPLPILLLLLQLPLIANPGYFSHDDIEWLARADAPTWSAMPWASWFDLTPLQYRPLTFNLWLVVARVFGTTPELMHFIVVCLGTANAWLLARVLVAARIPARVAFAAAIVFSLSPYVVYVHGWTGTLADILTLALGLLAARALQRCASTVSVESSVAYALASALPVAAALLCKESAIVLPALLLLAIGRETPIRRRIALIAPATAVVVVYLALRLPTLAAGDPLDTAYAWSLRHIPARLTEYLLYPFMPPLFEIAPLLSKGLARIVAAGSCIALLLGAFASIGWRWPLAWLIAFTAALAPVLVLAIAYDHYAYLASAAAIGIAAAAWPFMKNIPRIALTVLAAILMAHGIIVMARIHSVGTIQRNLYADLIAEIARSPNPLHIDVADARDAWLPGRLLRGVDTYRGVAIGARIRIGDEMPAQPADRLLWMNRDGHLHPDAAPLTPH